MFLAGNAWTGFRWLRCACTAVGLAVAAITLFLGISSLFADFWVGIRNRACEILLLQLAATLLCTGILGEYVGRAYWEAKRRPLYAVKRPAIFLGPTNFAGRPPWPARIVSDSCESRRATAPGALPRCMKITANRPGNECLEAGI